MALYEFEELQKKVSKIYRDETYKKLCKNIKKIRLKRYQQFKSQVKTTTINPYSTENISALLDYNHTHYKRFESETDSTKQMPLDKIVKLSIILDTTIDELLK